jgi:thiamine-phosphate pyrophosphorylase
MPKISPIDWSLYLVTDSRQSRGRSNLEIIQAAVRGGATVVQLREKEMSSRAFYEEGLKIKKFLKHAGVAFLINDRVDMALALDADGVHLGKNDIPLPVARELLGSHKIIGMSVEHPNEVVTAERDGADYLGASPIYTTPTKPELETGLGLPGLREIRQRTKLPLIAIGGMNRQTTAEVIAAGANGVAVVSAIVAANDPETATRAILEQVRKGRTRCVNPDYSGVKRPVRHQ